MNIMLIRLCSLVAKTGTFEEARYEHLTNFLDNILGTWLDIQNWLQGYETQHVAA